MIQSVRQAAPPISDEMLHAYVDGALSLEERLEVEAHLAANPRDAARVARYVEQNRGFHELFDHHLAAAQPPRTQELSQELGAAWRRSSRRRRGYAIAASVTLLAAAAASAWVGHRNLIDVPAATQLAGTASGATGDIAQNADWSDSVADAGSSLSGPFPEGMAVSLERPPDLSSQGFALVGGRAMSLPDSGTIELLYENERGARVTLHVSLADDEGETALVALRDQERSVLLWQREGLVFSLIGRADHEELAEIARVIDLATASRDPGDKKDVAVLAGSDETLEGLPVSTTQEVEDVSSTASRDEAQEPEQEGSGDDEGGEPITIEPLTEPDHEAKVNSPNTTAGHVDDVDTTKPGRAAHT